MTQSVDQAIRSIRVIVAGLIAGVVAFAVVAVIMRMGLPPRGSIPPLLLLGVLAMFAFGCAAAYAVHYQRLVRDLRMRAAELQQMADSSSVIVGPYRAFAIVGAGLIEGPSFFALIVYFLTGHVLAVAAAALGVILLIAHLPSHAALRRLAEKATQP